VDLNEACNILGVEPGADAEIIKKAYRKKALETHPDHNKDDPDAAEQFKKISEAYHVITNPQKEPPPAFNPFDFFNNFHGGSFSFGSAFHKAPPNRGASLKVRLDLSFSDLILGGKFVVNYERVGQCDKCSGLGGTNKTTCPDCGGQGVQERVIARPNGPRIHQRSMCGRCNARGYIVESVCEDCQGSGLVKERRQERIEVPPHTNPQIDLSTRKQLIITGRGNFAPQGGAPGDLVIEIIPKFPTINELTDEQKECLKQWKSGS
jgi:molecular chaperone DnaJ